MCDLTIELAGHPLRLVFDDEAAALAARARYRPFLARRSGGSRMHVAVVEGPVFRRFTLDPRVKSVLGSHVVMRRDLYALIGKRVSEAVVMRTPSSLDSLLRIWLSFALARGGGFLVHAAAAEGRLFPGASGAGKTTLGRKIGRGRLLSDELAAVVPGGRVWGTPFWGNFEAGCANRAEPLRGIYFLDRRAPRGVRPIPPGEAVVRLMECVLFFSDDLAWGRRLLSAAAACMKRVPSYVLSYNAATTSYGDLRKTLADIPRFLILDS